MHSNSVVRPLAERIVQRDGIALVMGIGLMYLILVMQFGSFTAPIAVMLSLP
jgi:multidrug efflux pump subunit AcrB